VIKIRGRKEEQEEEEEDKEEDIDESEKEDENETHSAPTSRTLKMFTEKQVKRILRQIQSELERELQGLLLFVACCLLFVVCCLLLLLVVCCCFRWMIVRYSLFSVPFSP